MMLVRVLWPIHLIGLAVLGSGCSNSASDTSSVGQGVDRVPSPNPEATVYVADIDRGVKDVPANPMPRTPSCVILADQFCSSGTAESREGRNLILRVIFQVPPGTVVFAPFEGELISGKQRVYVRPKSYLESVTTSIGYSGDIQYTTNWFELVSAGEQFGKVGQNGKFEVVFSQHDPKTGQFSIPRETFEQYFAAALRNPMTSFPPPASNAKLVTDPESQYFGYEFTVGPAKFCPPDCN